MKKIILRCLFISIIALGCDESHDKINPKPPESVIYYLPVVIHVLYNGEPLGEGANLSEERIKRQIEILNEDFRRKVGTRGYNDHPDGGDARIEFVLAKKDPYGQPTSGIVRINIADYNVPNLGYNQNHYAQYSFWNHDHYINVWTTPIDGTDCIVLGSSTLPESDLPGLEGRVPGSGDADGIMMNPTHFGESTVDCHAKFGRTLTHEMGHYLGLLHTWGIGNCQLNDYCDDTPPVDKVVFGRVAYAGCLGLPVMIGNYMNYSDDDVMNIFTNDQIKRMRYVLLNSPRRKSLLSSPGV
jgi:Pregnancy-associated plasma protein-A